MATWADIRKEAVTAARQLRDAGCYRGSTSRSYYALYAEISRVLPMLGVMSPVGREGPAHARIVPMLLTHLKSKLSHAELSRLADCVNKSYALRVFADYFPSFDIDSRVCNSAMSYQVQAITLLGRVR